MAATRGGANRVSDPTWHLGDAMSRVARLLQGDHGDVEGTPQAITAVAVLTVPRTAERGVDYVSGRRRIDSRALTSGLPRSVDSLQERLGQGPCMDAVWELARLSQRTTQS